MELKQECTERENRKRFLTLLLEAQEFLKNNSLDVVDIFCFKVNRAAETMENTHGAAVTFTTYLGYCSINDVEVYVAFELVKDDTQVSVLSVTEIDEEDYIETKIKERMSDG